MNDRVLCSELASRAGAAVELCGWVHRVRELGRVTFVVLRDRSGLAQIVAAPDAAEALREEDVVRVHGVVSANPRAPGGAELTGPAFEVLSARHGELPFELHRPALGVQLPTLLDAAPLALRHPRQRAAFTLTAAALRGFRSTLAAAGFTEIQTPKIVGSATESGANVFRLDYFGRPAFLAQSPQFFKQTMVGVFERVFEVGPVFRAEPHDTARHLSEYVSLDVELGFIRDHRDVMAVLREVVAGMVSGLAGEERAVDLLELDLPIVPREIPAIHFTDAQELISTKTGEDLTNEPDLAPAHERLLCEWAEAEHGSPFVFVTGYPLAKRPFYTAPDPDRPGSSNGFDLLFRGLELVTGGQRLHRYEDYVAAIEARGESIEPYAGYLQAFRYGMPPHGGFAIGLERFIARIVGAANIRETTLFPRDLSRLSP